LLYQLPLPTSRMSQIISGLYEFLLYTIVYVRRHRIGRYFAALWLPFEARFNETMEKIYWLQAFVENDARGTTIA
jgi:hypothetical protein